MDIRTLYFLNNLVGQSIIFDKIIIFFSDYFQYFLVAFFLFILFLSSYSKKKKYIILSNVFISVIVSRLVMTEIISFFYHRPRPFLVHPIDHLLNIETSSFPSGHAAFFFAMSFAIYCYNKKWGVGFIISSILITTSRVIAGVHYPSDIIGGIIVSAIAVYIVNKVMRWLTRE